eukprot:CAMPEP_0194380538 /NCGR_PEP_ID=MMETSP0174-20130528/45835_1 /TAXON_ID=216777 /ORGANISM="Proboscia alata, Strain PI-D3" /LENGTH=62 /DNA_ID=CAMNT_0039164017 /DNA_START=8 /DNA_END=196 /DNA_ORIENTATION=-
MTHEEIESRNKSIEETKTVIMEGINRSNGPNTLQSNEDNEDVAVRRATSKTGNLFALPQRKY